MITRTSGDSTVLDSLRTTAEVAKLLRLDPALVRSRAAGMRLRPIVIANTCHWTPSQVQRLRGER